ncbi:MAG: glycosyltransferase family 39 protein, partial [Actinomycetota bacterium]|nr:glycosyltransferase family 39 protein [Actinomycetota bacterium]
VALFALLVALSLFVRTRSIDASFWIDEGLTVGISSFPFLEIPAVLRQDGSPPLYYLLLHVWMDAFGSSEAATHALSVVFALLAIPAALWAAWSLFGRRAGWTAAALAALNPFLTIYAQETRMYSLVILLGLVATAAFVHAFVFRRRRYVAVFSALLALLLYTHNWALFFALGAIAALVVCARETTEPRRIAIDGALAFGGAALVFAPWVPTLVYQALHTGAPWSSPPSPLELIGGFSAVLSGQGSLVAVLLAGGVGLGGVVRGPVTSERTAILATITLTLVTLFSGWLYSQFSPAWANRYLGVLVGPVLLLAAAGLPRAGRLGLVALVLVIFFWSGFRAGDEKSNVRDLAATYERTLRPGDLIVSTQPEQVPVLAYYFGYDKRYATPLGLVEDTRVMDWRDALPELERVQVPGPVRPALSDLAPGRRLLLVWPLVRNEDAWDAPWTSLVRERSFQWAATLATDERFDRTQEYVPPYTEEADRVLRVVLYTKSRSG